MLFFYNLSISLYSFLVLFASLFNKKAKLRHKGVRGTWKKLKKENNATKTLWIHCASLGEFEQGRTFIEKFKERHPYFKVVLSFFSPSGYQVQKKTELADNVIYLPSDTKQNALNLIKYIKPDIVVFVKYEFWYHYLNTLNNKNIPTYLISGIFRKNQLFFKSYGAFFRKLLANFTHLFIQNEQSAKLLQSINLNNYTITGDTRFDRVTEIANKKKQIKFIDDFKQDKLTFIAGSSWFPDENLIIKFINETSLKIKFIIAPHEIHKSNIHRIINGLNKKSIRFSEKDMPGSANADVLIIDNIGMLSSLYGYADIAYIGGGFGVGIHNTLEAAVFGIPVIFGPKYQKFDEAINLIKINAAYSISNYTQFKEILTSLVKSMHKRNDAGKTAGEFVKLHTGSSDKILKAIQLIN